MKPKRSPVLVNLGEYFVKSQPKGWIGRVQKLIAEDNKTKPEKDHLSTNPGLVYAIAKRLSVKHPLWPFIEKVAEENYAANNVGLFEVEHEARAKRLVDMILQTA